MDSSSKLKSKLLLILSIITNLITWASCDSCTSYSCASLQDNLCLKLNTTIESSITITASSCRANTDVCPSFKLSSQAEVKCEAFPQTKIRQYPGAACKSSDDCMNNSECKSEKCFGAAENEPCERHDQCLFGLACYSNSTDSAAVASKACLKLRPSGAAGCESEFECKMHQGCFGGKCVDYFSLPDGAFVGKDKLANSHSFCASGHDKHGVCDSLRNVDGNGTFTDEPVECSEVSPCRYISLNGTITESDLCKCGKNKNAVRFCPIFGGNKHFKSAVKMIKDLLLNNRVNCNTLERDGTCNFHKLNNINDQFVLTYETLKSKMASYHEFAKADDCVKKIFYPQYNRDYDKEPVDPTGKKCPAFRCSSENNSEKKICARNSFDEKQNKTFVDLFKKSCDFETEYCKFDRSYLDSEILDSKCSLKPSSRKEKSYPGEACESDVDCYLLNGVAVEGLGKCSNKKCSGFASNANCTHTSQCNLGFYCKKNEAAAATCQKQEAEGSACDSIYDCRNGLICLNRKCANGFYSVNVGQSFSTVNFTEVERPKAPMYLCKFGLARQMEDGSFVCLMKNQTDSADSKQGNLVPCIPEQKCNYTLTDGKSVNEAFSLNCECGFNANAQGYCKAGQNISNFI